MPMKLSALAQPRFSSMYAEAHSPANQNGCFEFDRIIKAGSVLKRTRKTKVPPLSPFLHTPDLY